MGRIWFGDRPLDAYQPDRCRRFLQQGLDVARNKTKLVRLIQETTIVEPKSIMSWEIIKGASITTKLSWDSTRQMTKAEHIAYYLLGMESTCRCFTERATVSSVVCSLKPFGKQMIKASLPGNLMLLNGTLPRFCSLRQHTSGTRRASSPFIGRLRPEIMLTK